MTRPNAGASRRLFHAVIYIALLTAALGVLSACSVTIGGPAPTPGPGQPSNTPIEQVHFDVTHVPSPTPAPPTPTGGVAGPVGTGGTVKYTVKPGDALSVIAQQYGVTVEDIVKTNNIADPNQIKAGDVLLIPSRGAAGPTATPVRRPSPTPTPGR